MSKPKVWYYPAGEPTPPTSPAPPIDVLDKGFVRLAQSNFCDESAVLSAKVSYADDDISDVDFERFLGFLMKNKHGTPFEHCSATFHIKAPIFVFREWHRHRIGVSINEMSGRYTVLPEEWYVPAPEDIRTQVGKPGSYTYEQTSKFESDVARSLIDNNAREAFNSYHAMLDIGVAKEVARLVLPVNTYSMMYWTCNPRSLMNFLSLRNSPNAQREIRKYAEAMEAVFCDIMPVTAKAFIDNGRVSP